MANNEQIKSIYEISLLELLKNIPTDETVYLRGDNSLCHFFKSMEYEGRKLAFEPDYDFKKEQQKNGNLLRTYHFEYPAIKSDELVVKINHILSFEVDLQQREINWPQSLTEAEKEIMRSEIEKIEFFGNHNQQPKIFIGSIEITWTFVTFKYNCDKNEFELTKSQTITKY